MAEPEPGAEEPGTPDSSTAVSEVRYTGAVPAAIKGSLTLIGPRARRRYLLVVVAQMATALLDLLGVLLIGVTVLLLVSVPAGATMPASVATALDRLGLADVEPSTLAVWTGALAAVLLLGKSAVSALLLRRAFAFLARQQAQVSSRLARSWFSGDATTVHTRSDVEVENAVSLSVFHATTSLLGSLAVALAEVSLLTVLAVTLLIIDPVAAVLAAATFGLVSVGVHRVLGRWAGAIGTRTMARSVAGRTKLREALDSFRELRAGRRLGFPLASFEDDVRVGASGAADLMFVNNVPKIAYEAALVVGGIVIVGWRSWQGDVNAALAFLAVFLTAAARLLPSMVRLQGQLVTMSNAAAQGRAALELGATTGATAPTSLDDLGRAVPARDYPGFTPSVEVDGVSVTYAGAQSPALDRVSLRIEPGSSLVLVGPTGAGKSTLVDVILGMIEPELGVARVGGLPPVQAQSQWPGAVSYMPQHSTIWNLTVRQNVALGLPPEAVVDDDVWQALEHAQLAGEIREKGGLDLVVGPSGRLLSGGQRQRLGIARALYSRPRLLVLDEATSALDEQTEQLIGRVLDELRGEVTVLAVAHRRSTIERATQVAELSAGRVVYLGRPADAPALRR